jgi:hypothetical protein
MGFRGAVSRNTLANANQQRDWRIYADFARLLIRSSSRVRPIPLTRLVEIAHPSEWGSYRAGPVEIGVGSTSRLRLGLATSATRGIFLKLYFPLTRVIQDFERQTLVASGAVLVSVQWLTILPRDRL